MKTSLCVCTLDDKLNLITDEIKEPLKNLFLQFGNVIDLIWLPSFQRVLVKYELENEAEYAKQVVDGSLFQDIKLRAFLMEIEEGNEASRFLNVPEIERMFLISPPASPPLGWEQTEESEPVVQSNHHIEFHAHDIATALEKHAINSELNEGDISSDGISGKIIFVSNEDLPVIVVENYDENDDNFDGNIHKRISIQRTRMPAR